MAIATPRPSSFGHKFRGCSSIEEYEVLSKLGEGTFGEVYKGKSRTGSVVALKKILMHNEKDGFPVTAIREIKLLKMLSHVNVLRLDEMAVERAKTKERKKAIMYMVTPYMEHDLSGMLTNPDIHFTEPQIKCYMLQLLEGLRYLHSSHILHRDMKAANLLISNKGVLQIADFGLARHYEEPPPTHPGQGYGEAKRDYTALVVTRWYRPPELLLGLRRYTPAIDLWGVGCVFGEMFKRVPVLQGGSDVAQIQMIFDLVGSPTEDSMPGWSSLPGCEGVKEFELSQPKLNQRFRELSASACSLLTDLLRLNWKKRITAVTALNHPYFRTDPPPAKPENLPIFEDSHELDHRKDRNGQKGPPPAPAGGTVGQGPEKEEQWGRANDAHSLHPNGRDAPYGSRPPSRDGRPRGAPPHIDRYEPGPPRKPPGWAVAASEQNGHRSAGPPGHSRENRGEKDTYIPAYSGGDRPPRDDRAPRSDRPLRDDRPPRDDGRDGRWQDRRDDRWDDRRRDRDGPRESGYAYRERSPRRLDPYDRERDRRSRWHEDRRPYDDRRSAGLDYDDRRDYRHQSREIDERSRGTNGSRRPTRSRSPEKPRPPRDSDMDPYSRRA